MLVSAVSVNNSPFHCELRSNEHIGAEDVLFSCRGEVLVSKFGRSSKPAPRILVLVGVSSHDTVDIFLLTPFFSQ